MFEIQLNDGKSEFSAAITPVFSVKLYFRNNLNMLIWGLGNIFHN